MPVVHKYDLTHGLNILVLPINYKSLCVGMQDNEIKLWVYKGRGESKTIQVDFRVVGTGEVFEGHTKYIGSAFEDHQFVWHVFEVMK